MPRRLLLAQYSSNRDGSAQSALLLADGLQAAGWAVHVAFGFPGPMVDVFRDAGHPAEVVPHKSWLRSSRLAYWLGRVVADEWRAARAFEAVLDAVRPEIVYVNTSVSLAAVLAARRGGVPCLWHLRELFADVGGEMRVPRGLRPLVRRAFPYLSTRLVVNSRAVAENMLGHAEGVAVVPNAVGDSFFDIDLTPGEARERLNLPAQGPILGVPGTLRPMKGHPFFFDAVAPLAHADPSLHIAVTGGGTPAYRRQLAEHVARLGLSEQVRFLGSIDTMPAFYRACDAVCIPSVAEPFGRTVIEAFAAGTPVVATAVGGIRETVTHGETGLLVPYGDQRALTDALTVMRDLAARRRLARQARAKADAHYRDEIYQQRLVHIVNETAGVAAGGSVPLTQA